MDFYINLYTQKGCISLPLNFYPRISSERDEDKVKAHIKENLSQLFGMDSEVRIETAEDMG